LYYLQGFCTTFKQNWPALEGYIFPILQHFAMKLSHFTNFEMLFVAVVIDLVNLTQIIR
jgi:hypothetical protein